jgi:hypothetical protein
LTALTVQVSQSGRTWVVGSGIDASGDHYTFRLPIHLPEELQPGTAVVRVKDYGTPAEVLVRA